MYSRRRALGVLASCLALAPAVAARAEGSDLYRRAETLPELIRQPLLVQTLFSKPASLVLRQDGAVTDNAHGLKYIELQRQGAEWITRGVVSAQADWIERGWRQIDWGVERQLADGSYAHEDSVHSTSLFMEALARSCIIDPQNATAPRRDCLARGVAWLLSPQIVERYAHVLDSFFHRRFVFAALVGETALVLNDATLRETALSYANGGFAAQLADGSNPELGGYDVNYQLAGCLSALRYLTTNPVSGARAGARIMVGAALDNVLTLQRSDGSFDTSTSVRVGNETERTGEVKTVNFPEVMQTLVYASVLLDRPEWLDNARIIVGQPKWCRHEEGPCD